MPNNGSGWKAQSLMQSWGAGCDPAPHIVARDLQVTRSILRGRYRRHLFDVGFGERSNQNVTVLQIGELRRLD